MKKKAIVGKILSGVLLFGGMVVGQEPEEEAKGPNEKAERYHKLLLKRPGNATVFNRFVDAWLDTGNKEGMKSWLEQSAKAGGSAEWRVLAAYHEYLGEDEEALGAFNQAVSSDDQDAALRLGRAKLHAKLLAFEAALEDLKVATADEKLGVEASKLTGIYLARAGQVEEAVKAWKEVIERFPKDEELREDLIEVEVAEGLYDDAIEASQALVAMTKDPYKKALRQLRLGDIQIIGGKREEGLKTYETIMAATGADTWLEREVLAQVERVFMREDDIQGLRDFFQKLREEHPRRVSVRKALARQMALNGEMDEAVALFREVLKITPGDIGNREEFIAFLETNERWKEAQEELAELIKLREDDPLLWERMAQIEEKQNNPEGVKAALAKVRDLKKGTPEGLIAVAALYTQADFLPEAEALLREGQQAFAESDELVEALASFLIQNGKEAEALAMWTKMAETAGREGLLRVARSLTGHGKSEEAFKLLQGRMAEFEKDSLILAQFCSLASSEEEAEIALPFGLEMLRQAASPTDLDAALKVVGRVIKKSDQLDEVLKDLEGKADATISERCLVTDLYLQQGDTIKALEILTATEQADEGLLARFYRVRYEESQGELEQAIASLRAILELPQGRKTVHLRRLVGLLESNDDLKGALAAVDDWKRMAPGDQSAWKRRADLLSNYGEADQAVLELRRMIGKFGAEEDSRAKLADALLEANEHHSAQRIYEQLYEEGEDLSTKLKWVGQLAQLAQKEGTLDDLLADFERRKRENSNSVAPLLALAEIHHSLNQYEERRTALLEASRRRPNDIKLLQHIAEVEVRAGEFDRAVGLLKDAAKRDTTPGTKQKLAKLFLQNGEYQEGLRMLKELPDHSDDPRKVEGTALSLMGTSEYDLAVEYLEEFLPKHSTDWRLRYLYAVALEVEGDEENALTIYTELLEAEGKIKGVKPLFDPKVYQRGYYRQQMNSATAMKGWTKFRIMNQFVDTDRNYQNRSRWNRSYSSTVVNLPGDLEEVKMLSLSRATFLANQFEEEKRDEVLKALTIEGIERLDLYRMSQGDRIKYFNKIDELLKGDPENPKLFAIWSSYLGSAEKDYKVEAPRFAQLLASASKQGPDSAVSFISLMLRRDQVDRSEAVKIVSGYYQAAEEDEEKMKLLQSLVYLMNSQLTDKPDDEFRELAETVIADILAFEKKPKEWRWVSSGLNLAIKMEDHDSAITLFNRISGWLKRDSASPSPLHNNHYHHHAQWGSRGSGYQSAKLGTPHFPPTAVKGFPSSMSRYLKLVDDKSQNSSSKDAKRLAELTQQLTFVKEQAAQNAENSQHNGVAKEYKPLEIFRGRTKEIEIPIIRSLIGASLGEENALPDFVSSVTDSNDYEELELAAGYLWKQKKQLESYQVLCRMRMLTLSRTQRRTIDGTLAKVGAILSGQEEDWDKEPAQRAALRLRKVMVNQNDKQALFAVLLKLGLEKEAGMLSKSALKKSSSTSSSSRSRNRQGVPHVVGLAANGRPEEAARSAAKLIRSYQKNSNSNYEMTRLVDALQKLEIVDATLEKLHPGDSQSISRRLAYAELAQSVKRPDLAKPFYEAIVKERPTHAGARVGLFMSLPEEERAVTDLLGEDGSEIDYESLQNTMSNLWERVDDQFDETIAIMEMTAQLLDSMTPNEKAERNLSWVPYHIASALNDYYYNGTRIGSLIAKRQGDSYDKEKTEIFDGVAKKIFIAMMKHPQIAKQGFMALSQSQENLGLSDEEVSEYASKALVQVARLSSKHPSKNHNLWTKYYKNGSSSSYSLNGTSGPFDYLLASETSKDELLKELLPILKENQPERYESMTLSSKMLALPSEEAIATFDQWYGEVKKKHEKANQKTDKIFTELVNLGADLLLFKPQPSAFLDHVEAELLKIYTLQWNDPSGWKNLSKQWLGWIALHKDQAAVRAFIIAVCETSAGPQEDWPILAEMGVNKLPNPYRQRMYELQQKLTLYCSIEKAVVPVLEISMEGEFSKFLQNFSTRNLFYNVTNGFNDPDKFVAWLKETGVLDQFSEVKPDAIRFMASLDLVNYFPNPGNDFGQKVLKKVEALEFHPLLEQLLVQRYGDTSQKKKLPGVWEEHIDLLKLIVEKNPEVMLGHLKKWFPKLDTLEKTPQLLALLTELREGNKDELRKEGEQWLVDGIELDPNDYQGRELWVKVFKIAKIDAVLGAKLVKKVFEAVEENPSNNPFSSSRNSTSPTSYYASSFFRQFDGSHHDLVTKIRLIDMVYRSDVGTHLLELEAQGSNTLYYIRNSLKNEVAAFVVPADSKRKKIELAFESWTKKLSPEQEETFVAIALTGFIRNRNLSEKDVEGVEDWANQELRKESELMADALVTLVKAVRVWSSSSKKKEGHEKVAADAMGDLVEKLDIPEPLVVDLVYALSYSSNTRCLLAGPQQWKLIAENWPKFSNGVRNVSGSRYLRVFETLSRLQFDERKESVKDLLKAINGTVLTPELYLQSRNSSSGQWLKSLLPMTLEVGDVELAKQLIQQNSSSFRGELALMLDVAGAIDVKTAVKLAPATTLTYSTSNLPRYTKEVAATALTVSEALSPRDRFRFEVMVAGLKDSTEEELISEVPRAARLEALAKRFEKEAPIDNAPRWQLLGVFSSEPPVRKSLAAAFKKEAEKSSLSAAIVLQDQGNRQADGRALVAVIRQFLANELDSGRPEVMHKEITTLAKLAGGDSYYSVRSLGRELTSELSGYLLEAAIDHPEKASALTKLSRENSQSRFIFERGSSSNDSRAVIWRDYFIHIWAGETQAWHDHFKEHVEKKSRIFNGPFGKLDQYGLSEMMDVREFKGEARAKDRVKLLTKAFLDPVFVKKSILQVRKQLPSFRDAGFVKQGELFTIIDALPDDHSRKAEFMLAKAEMYFWKNRKKVKEASKFYREARALALSQEQEEVVHLADALHARIFGRNKRTLEAWKIGQRVNLELLPEGDQKWFKKESLGWKKAVEENPEKAPKSKESEKPKSPVEK